jgi:hypothetical protein
MELFQEVRKFTSPYNHRCITCKADTKVIANRNEDNDKILVVMTECRPCNTVYKITFSLK